MKEYIQKQNLLKGLVILVAILIIVAIIFLQQYYFERPSDSKIYITDYSKIIYDRVNCQSFRPTLGTWRDYFPIVLHYKTPNAYSSFKTDDGYFSERLYISRIESIYLTTENGSIEIPNSGSIIADIQAHSFRWDSNVTPNDFKSIGTLEFDRLYGQSDDDSLTYYGDVLDWIKPVPLDFTVGLCAENLRYIASLREASFTKLNSIGMSVSSLVPYEDKVALLFEFENVISFSIDAKNYQPGDQAQLQVIFEKGAGGFDLFATGLDEKDIAICDSVTNIQPGYICSRFEDNTQQNFAKDLLDIKGNAQSITITSPQGWTQQRFIRKDLQKERYQLTVSANLSNIEINQTEDNQPLEIVGNRINAQLDGDNLFPAPWEKLPSELKAVWVTILASILTGLVGFGIQRSSNVSRFWKWFATKPDYKPPVIINNEAYIFQLINGKKISGVIETFEGRSTFRIFILKEVREWDKDNWSEVLSIEVRVPQNQIEMYYKAHP